MAIGSLVLLTSQKNAVSYAECDFLLTGMADAEALQQLVEATRAETGTNWSLTETVAFTEDWVGRWHSSCKPHKKEAHYEL